MRYDTTLRFLGVLSACAAIAACATAPSTQPSPLPPEFGLVKELSPEFASSAEGWFHETSVGTDGRKIPVIIGGIDFRCAGRPPEYFGFAEDEDGRIRITSHSERTYGVSPDPETYPMDMLKTFTDRSQTSDEDAVKKISQYDPFSPRVEGIADYITREDGWIIAYDEGEFGGALVWLPKSGDSYFISEENTSDLEQVGDIIYAAQGLDHFTPQGGIRVVTRENNRWVGYRQFLPTFSSVSKLAYRDGLLIGITRYGIVVVDQDRTVHYSAPERGNSKNVVQWAEEIFIDRSGRVFVGGVDVVGVYSGLPGNLVPDLYARRDCNFDYGEAPKEHR